MTLDMTPEELLTTTRAVRKRLDFSKPVEREVIEECLAIAQQAPTASNAQSWHFIVVTDEEKRAAIAEYYRKGWEVYINMPESAAAVASKDEKYKEVQGRVVSSAQYLAENMEKVPVMVIPCITGRTDNAPVMMQSAQWGTIGPATWNFMLAARTRGLGTCFTSIHLLFEKEVAGILGIPYDEIMQTALIPVAYSIGTDFKRAHRMPLENIVHWDSW